MKFIKGLSLKKTESPQSNLRKIFSRNASKLILNRRTLYLSELWRSHSQADILGLAIANPKNDNCLLITEKCQGLSEQKPHEFVEKVPNQQLDKLPEVVIS